MNGLRKLGSFILASFAVLLCSVVGPIHDKNTIITAGTTQVLLPTNLLFGVVIMSAVGAYLLWPSSKD